MKTIVKKITFFHVVVTFLILVFGLSLFLPSTREAHVLCARLLLHLKGQNTFVQGNPAGCNIFTIPNVQFTDEYQKLLRSRSGNSLNDFILAVDSSGSYGLEFPQISTTWTNCQLELAAFQITWMARQRYLENASTNKPPTNTAALTFLKSAHDIIGRARNASPSNGVWSLAEASIYFIETDKSNALAALHQATINKDWDTDSAHIRNCSKAVFEKAGLSKLDAAAAANLQNPEVWTLAIQATCYGSIHELLTQAVQKDDEQEFTSLLHLVTELRRANFIGEKPPIQNKFRPFKAGDNLAHAMAKHLGEVLPERDKIGYGAYYKLKDQIFHSYLDKLKDQKTTATFVTQAEDYENEQKLRILVREFYYHQLMWSWIFSSVSGVSALFALSFLVVATLFEITLPYIHISTINGRLHLNGKVCLQILLLSILGAFVFMNFFSSSGINSQNGFGLADQPSMISPALKSLLASFLGSLILGLGCLWMWILALKKSTSPPKRGTFVIIMAYLYLIVIFAMAWFRANTAQKLISGGI